ncbi:MAG TPA: type II toxin-antitoxin system RelE/ParE family toxin [Thermoplasmata archaeon]|nr:type II toxin-antitoxin system RelE/ParE family toxin [Thermoplasmata archaeon]
MLWSESAARQLAKLDRAVAKRILQQVQRLEHDPIRSLRRLVASPYYRLRVGDYRLILEVTEGQLRVLLLKVGHRRSVY